MPRRAARQRIAPVGARHKQGRQRQALLGLDFDFVEVAADAVNAFRHDPVEPAARGLFERHGQAAGRHVVTERFVADFA